MRILEMIGGWASLHSKLDRKALDLIVRKTINVRGEGCCEFNK